MQRMARNAKALGRPDALFKIVRDLAQLAEHEERDPAAVKARSVNLQAPFALA
jgi:hypothetical protein